MGRGLCNRCYEKAMAEERSQLTELKYPILKCSVDGCEAMTRSPKDNAALAPGTRRRISHGQCSECYKSMRINVPDERVQAAKSELDSFLAARARRAEAAARRPVIGQRFRAAS
jgi:hypothetical protein